MELRGTHRPKKPTSLFQTALIIPCFSKNPSSGGFFSADHRGCVHPINSNEKPQLIKGGREILRFRVTVKGCFFAGLPPPASFHEKLEERGWVLRVGKGFRNGLLFQLYLTDGEMAAQEAKGHGGSG